MNLLVKLSLKFLKYKVLVVAINKVAVGSNSSVLPLFCFIGIVPPVTIDWICSRLNFLGWPVSSTMFAVQLNKSLNDFL